MGVVYFMLFSFLFCVLVLPIPQARAQDRYSKCYNDIGNYTSNSTYETNLKTVFSTLNNMASNKENSFGFYNLTYGENSDKVYAICLCRGDVKLEDCPSCCYMYSVYLKNQCPNQKVAISWTEHCIVRYSNHSILGILDTTNLMTVTNQSQAPNTSEFAVAVQNLMKKVTTTAASGDSRRKYASGTTSSDGVTIYALAQCMPDLSHDDCYLCLNNILLNLSANYDKIDAREYTPSCVARYRISPYFGPTVDLDLSPSPSPLSSHQPPRATISSSSQKGKSNKSGTSIIVVVLVVIIIVLLIICVFVFLFLYLRMRKARKFLKAEEDDDDIKLRESLQFNFDTISVATSDFSNSNKLGQGGFGAVYMGKLCDGQEIAVKRLSRESGQGDIEFKNEIVLVAKLQHRNLVKLLGFCIEERERLLVYEFVPNKSLDYFIFDQVKKQELDWVRRYKIISGTARGLLYLHEDSRLRIIHRDLKASNILLDEDMNPKISDFGMAKLFVVDQTQGNTNRIVGTDGYMAPEYALHGQFSVKSDVFSFGVMVLEIVFGHKNKGMHYGENMEDMLSFVRYPFLLPIL